MQQEPGVWVNGPDGELIPDYESTFPEINEGEVVHGTVVRVDKDEVLVDIGYKSEGVIPVAELSIRRSVNPADEVTLGDEIDALVLTKEDAEGRLILSKKRARFELAWKNIERAAESGEPVDGRVIEVVKGGLILDLGVRGFLPASLVDIRRVQDLDEFLGQELRCKVIELNRSRNNVVLSRRAVLEEERKEQRQQILDRLQPGAVVEGQISNIVDFGAFVDLDGMDGLIHISELSWSHVNHPSEILEIGQTVKVKVLDIDRDRQRISLGLKQTQNDPWQQVLESYHENDVVEGRVTKVVTFGAFVEILPGVEGLVHISELAQHHVENPREVVSQGQAVNVKIIEIDGERRRLSLSLKRVEPDDPVQPRADGGESVHLHPTLDLSDRADGGEDEDASGYARAGRRAAARTIRSGSRLSRGRRRARGRRGRGDAGAGCRGRSRRRGPAAGADEPAAPEAEADRRGVTSPGRSPSRSPAASGRGRARRWPRSRATARRPSRATRSSTSCSAATRSRRRIVERFGHGVVGPDGELDRGAIGDVVFNDREQLTWLEELLHPLVVGGVPALARAARRAPEPAAGLRDRGAAPLRGGRRGAFRQGGRRHGAGGAFAARARTWPSRSGSSGSCPTSEKIARADYAYVNTGSLEELDAFVGSVMDDLRRMRRARRSSASCPGRRRRRGGALRARDEPAVVRAASAIRSTTPRSSASGPRPSGIDPALLAAVIYQESKFRPDARSSSGAIGLMQLTPSTAKGIALRTGGTAFTSTTSRTRRSTSATAAGTSATCSRSTAHCGSCSPPTTPGRATSTAGARKGRGSSSRDAGVRRARRAPAARLPRRVARAAVPADADPRGRREREHLHAARPGRRADRRTIGTCSGWGAGDQPGLERRAALPSEAGGDRGGARRDPRAPPGVAAAPRARGRSARRRRLPDLVDRLLALGLVDD